MTETTDSSLGQVISGRYRLLSLIAEGGMGRIYRAEHVELREPVVVKFLHQALASEPLIRQRFRLEAKALIRLRHPGIVAIHDYGEHEGIPYIALELLEGPTLNGLIHTTGRLPLPHVFPIFEQLLDVLVATHTAGVIHRDLKPENVIVQARPGLPLRVTVLDFGIASLSDDSDHPDPRLTRTGAVFGTPSYMSPEQCRGRGVSALTDVYSVSVMLFEAITGQLPFVAESAAEVFAKQLYVRPPTLAEKGAPDDLPPGLEPLLRRGLAKRAVDRPSAAAFQKELREIASGEHAAWRRDEAEVARLQLGWQSREERAAAFSGQPGTSADVAKDDEETRARVGIWGFSAPRAASLADTLAANGLDAVVVSGGLAPADVDVVLAAGLGWEARLRQVVNPDAPGPPVLVADIHSAGDIPALVRAGANDVALGTIPDDALVAKLLRLIRRRR